MTSPDLDAEAKRASREAIDWLILLQDDPDNAQQQADFACWLARSPAHAAAWARHGRTYDLLGAIPAETAEQWRDAPRGAAPAATRRARRRPSRRTLMGMALAACLAVLIAPEAVLRLRADGITGTAELRRLPLPDGSIAMLAPGSALSIAYTDRDRGVDLLRGEAWFDVRHDPTHPFHVQSGATRTTVLGTAFDVALRAGGVRVAVERGHVRVDGPGANIDLLPGQWADLSSGKVRRGEQAPLRSAPWKSGKLVVNDRTIADALDQLRPWYGGRILLLNRALGQRPVTGIYDPRAPVDAVRDMVGVYGGSVHRITPWLLVIS